MDSRELHDSFAALVSFIYSGLNGNVQAIEEMVEAGILRAELRGFDEHQGGARSVEVDIDITFEHDVEEIYERYKRGEGDELSPAEIGVLVREGRLGPEDYENLSWDEDERPLNPRIANVSWWHVQSDSE
jgi:hypothetical protein